MRITFNSFWVASANWSFVLATKSQYFQFFLSCIVASRIMTDDLQENLTFNSFWVASIMLGILSLALTLAKLSILSELHLCKHLEDAAHPRDFQFFLSCIKIDTELPGPEELRKALAFNSFWVASWYLCYGMDVLPKSFNSFWVASTRSALPPSLNVLSILSELHRKRPCRDTPGSELELSILSELHPNFSTRGGLYV